MKVKSLIIVIILVINILQIQSQTIIEFKTTNDVTPILLEPDGRVICNVTKGKTIQILSYDPEHKYYNVKYKDYHGWTEYQKLGDIDQQMRIMADKQYEESIRIKELEVQENEKAIIAERDSLWALEKKKISEEQNKDLEWKKYRLVRIYGERNANRILSGEIWIGMTSEMARDSKGSPNKINKTVGNWGVHEQWVYDNKYLYFENDVLTSWQD